MADVVGGGTENVTLYDENGTAVAVAVAVPPSETPGLVVRTVGPVSTRLSDTDGAPYNSINRLPVNIDGGSITGTFTTEASVVSAMNIPPVPLAANDNFTGEWEDVLKYAAISVAIFTDQASAPFGAVIEFSADATTAIRSVPTTIPANFGAYFHLSPEARYVRIRYTNGPVAQTVLRVSILFSYQTPAEVVQPLGSTITDANVGTVVRSALAARIFSGASTGAYAPLGTDGAGNLLVKGADMRTLTERMFAKAPATGFALWLDTASVTHIFLAEAPLAADGTASTFRGIRVSKDATGNPVGKVSILDGFIWDNRSTATWP